MAVTFQEDVRIPHLALPFRLVGGKAAVTEQDSLDEIAHCVEAIVRYRRGYRPEALDFGIDDQAFREGGADIRGIQQAIEDAEDRGGVLADLLDDAFASASSLAEGLENLRILVREA